MEIVFNTGHLSKEQYEIFNNDFVNYFNNNTVYVFHHDDMNHSVGEIKLLEHTNNHTQYNLIWDLDKKISNTIINKNIWVKLFDDGGIEMNIIFNNEQIILPKSTFLKK